MFAPMDFQLPRECAVVTFGNKYGESLTSSLDFALACWAIGIHVWQICGYFGVLKASLAGTKSDQRCHSGSRR